MSDTKLIERRGKRFLIQEPFALCWGAGFVGTWLSLAEMPAWTAPIAISTFIASWFADVMWQAHLKARPDA